jgi:signal transduction histidine kinase
MEKTKKGNSGVRPTLLLKLWAIVTLSSFAAMVITFSVIFTLAATAASSEKNRAGQLNVNRIAAVLQNIGREELISESGREWIFKVIIPLLKTTWDLQSSIDSLGNVQAGAWILDAEKKVHLESILSLKNDRIVEGNIGKKLASGVSEDGPKSWQEGNWFFDTSPLKDGQGVFGWLCYASYFGKGTWPRIVVTFFSAALPTLFVFCLICGVVSSFVAAFYIRRRIRHMVYAVDGMFSGDFSRRCGQKGRDELGLLASRLDLLNGRLPALLKDHEENGAREEKIRLARDLHDGIKQDLFALILGAGNLVTMIGEENVAAAQARKIEASLKSVLEEIKILISAVMPAEVTAATLQSAIMAEFEKWKSGGLSMSLDLDLDSAVIDDYQAGILLKIACEALANSARHSGADRVKMSLVSKKEKAVFDYSDNGKGLGKDFHPGLGISMMKSRVLELGATVEFLSGQGLSIIIAWPKGAKR